MIVVVDFAAGNLGSVVSAFQAIGENPVVSDDPGALEEADAIVLPGVGAFGSGFQRLQDRGLVEPLHDQVLRGGKPFLGICLGMQFLAEAGLEGGRHPGLGWVRGTVREMTSSDPQVRIPHMGWNEVDVTGDPILFRGLGDRPAFYFLHGYHLDVIDADAEAVSATCDHGRTYIAAVEKGNIRGVQFHPEKSQLTGLRLLQNFLATIE